MGMAEPDPALQVRITRCPVSRRPSLSVTAAPHNARRYEQTPQWTATQGIRRCHERRSTPALGGTFASSAP